MGRLPFLLNQGPYVHTLWLLDATSFPLANLFCVHTPSLLTEGYTSVAWAPVLRAPII